MKILVVDDATINRMLIEQVLDSEGHTVVSAANGQEALDQLAHQTDLHVVICDLIMPDMDGVEVYQRYLQRCSNQGNDAHIPFILLTAAQEIGRPKDAKDIGFIDILTKPPDYERLKSILTDLEAKQAWKGSVDRFAPYLKTIRDLTTSIIEGHDVDGARL